MAAPVRDQWLSEVAGFECLRLDPADAAASAWAGQVRSQAAFVYCKVPVLEIAQVKALSSSGLYVVDTNVTLEVRGAVVPGPAIDGVEVRGAEREDHADAQRIAGNAFVFSRFHLDPLVAPELAHRIKREWIRSYCEGRRGECLLVARRQGRVVGFLAVLTVENGGRKVAVIDLIAVDGESRGQGIGGALVRHFLHQWRGCDVLRVGTQVANAASLRLYQQCGFVVAESSYVMHGHLKGGKVL